MLSILDKYIIRKFLGTFFFMMTIIMSFAMVFDVSEKLSDFISNDAPVSVILKDYYLPFILFYGNLFSSMIIFISVIWFTAKMAQQTEIVPIWFSGRPFNRYLRPYMLTATFLMILSLLLNHWIVPNANKLRLQFEENYYRNELMVENYHADYQENIMVYFANYSNNDKKAYDFTVQKWNDSSKIIYFLKARQAFNVPNTNKWQLTDYYEKSIGFPEVKTEHGAKKDTTFPFQITEMAQRENRAESMTYSELTQFIEREKLKGSDKVPYFEIELHQRTSYPFASYILTLIGVSVASQKRRGGIGMNIAIGLAFVFIYIFSMKMLTVASINVGFPALLSVWIPNFIFAIVAFILYKRAQK